MTLLKKDIFVCLDCETTGLEPSTDQIIEIAVVVFSFDNVIKTFETLIDPGCPIPESSIAIHHIDNSMIVNKPKIQEVLPAILQLIGQHIIIGHGIGLDIAFLMEASKRNAIRCTIDNNPTLDTLRMARLYGESPTNSLERLREHFNIASEGAHRAMNDVIVNIEVFKYLSANFQTTQQLFERLKRPILLKAMPLGKHKGRPFAEIPIEYLQWAANKDFDQDLLFSIRTELKKRKKGNLFVQSASPFSSL